MPYWHYGTGGGWLGPLLVVIVLLVLLAATGVITARLVGRGTQHKADDDSAVDILRERFARGEIDQDEYERRRAALKR
ncbi:SHOCT domain-containing protein [Amycolatopsis carbonis]|uniref:SHOCT domain-containing protein n=1 Tax=Amycolatopsis carbonis TaxID=715471 RepID=A0A9Y2I817_9PSEU|nr:SHOCT domain-containing protein [Amycolatopsis sp. 2-15]WIX75485.1 SHOCT domain-containing protein [Amycolatopsis sp. 2-15]